MRELFRNPTFVKLFLASFASQMGTTIGNMAFAFYLLDRFASQPGYAALAEMVYAMPTLLVFFLVGVLADRFDRQRIAEYTGWIRAGLTLVLLGTLMIDSIPLIFAVLFLRAAVAKFYAPAESAMLQGVLESGQYMQASGLNQMIFGVFILFGVGLGALAYNTVGIFGAVAIDASGFLASALLVRRCRIPMDVRLPRGKARLKEIGLRSVLGDFREGFIYVLQNKLLRSLVSGFLLFGLLNGGFAVLPIFTMKYKLAPDSYEKFSSLFAVFLGVGFLIGSTIGATLVQKLKPHMIIIWGIFGSSVLTGLLGAVSDPWLYLILILLAGMVLAPVNIALGGWLPHIVEPAKMGRVSAWLDPVLMLGQTVSLGLISLLFPNLMSLGFIYAAMAVIMLLAFILYLLTLPALANQTAFVKVGDSAANAANG